MMRWAGFILFVLAGVVAWFWLVTGFSQPPEDNPVANAWLYALYAFLVAALFLGLGLWLLRGRLGRLLGALALTTLFVVAAVLLLSIGMAMRGYALLFEDQPVAELHFRTAGPQQYSATLLERDAEPQIFELRGDEWQIDARVIRWSPVATLWLGFRPAYRLERLGGRYRNLADEQGKPRTVHGLATRGLDLGALAHEHPGWLPFVHATYGSATYLPMADGARYRVTLTASGLAAEPLNDPARQAVQRWSGQP